MPRQRIREVYVNKFDDEQAWWFYCWLAITEKGLQWSGSSRLAIAEAIEARRESTRELIWRQI